MADHLLTQFKSAVEGLTLVPFSDGRFEVSVDNTPVYSKLETGIFPDNKAVASDIQKIIA